MKSPFYKVLIAGVDVSEYIETFEYEDSIKKHNKLELKIKSDHSLRFLEDPTICTGAPVEFIFGFLGGKVSEKHYAEIRNVEGEYDEKIMCVISAYDKGSKMKQGSSDKVYVNMTTSSIIEEVAKRYDMSVMLGVTQEIAWDCIPQAHMNDLDFLKYLAKKESNGSYIAYVKNNTIYYEKRATSGTGVSNTTDGAGKKIVPSSYLFTYGVNIVSFKTKHKELEDDGSSNDSNVVGYDPENKAAVGSSVKSGKQADNVPLGDYTVKYDENGVRLGVDSSAVKTIVAPVKTDKEAADLANANSKDAGEDLYTAELEFEGVPDILQINSIVTVAGVAAKHGGNWYVHEVKHKIDTSGYLGHTKVSKNAASDGVGDKETEANKTVGDNGNKATVQVANYTENGVRTGTVNQ